MGLIEMFLDWWNGTPPPVKRKPVINNTLPPGWWKMIDNYTRSSASQRKTTPPRPGNSASQVKILPPRNAGSSFVRADNTSLALKRGWIRNGNKYTGYFRTSYGAWKGEISRRGDKFDVFINNPPVKQLMDHSRWPCFHKKDRNVWRINLAVNPKDRDVGAIIFNIERIIIESFQLS